MVTFHPDYRGCDWRKLRAAALQESRAHRAYARLGLPTPNAAPLTMWYDGRLDFDELLPDAGDKNGKNMRIKLSWRQLAEFCGTTTDSEVTHIGDIGLVHRITGITRTTLISWRRHGIPMYAADDIACNLGVHPSAIWPHWYEITAVADVDEEAL